MNNALISVAVCTYNGEKFLAAQLETIVNQTYPNFEIVVVDDASTDATFAILEAFAARFDVLRIFRNQANLGYIKNFERAIGLCRGEYIALADQDDLWKPDKLAQQMRHLGNNALIYHDSAFINEQGETLQRKMSNVRKFYAGNDSRYFLFENCVSGHAVLFKKAILQHFDKFPEGIFHDWWLAYTATANGGITYLRDCLVSYRQHTSTATDILKKKSAKREERSRRFENFRRKSLVLCAADFGDHVNFKKELATLLEKSRPGYRNVHLALFVWRHRKILLYFQGKSFWSQLNYCRKLMHPYGQA